jgi:hypothetical protein
MGYKKIWDCGKYRFIYKYEWIWAHLFN